MAPPTLPRRPSREVLPVHRDLLLLEVPPVLLVHEHEVQEVLDAELVVDVAVGRRQVVRAQEQPHLKQAAGGGEGREGKGRRKVRSAAAERSPSLLHVTEALEGPRRSHRRQPGRAPAPTPRGRAPRP